MVVVAKYTLTKLEPLNCHACVFQQCVSHRGKCKAFHHLINYFFLAEENSCSSSDAVWMNREQNVQTPVMMHSPHLTSTVLKDPKKMRPEDSYTATYSMPSEQHPHQPVPPQQQPHHHHQTAIDYKYENLSGYLSLYLTLKWIFANVAAVYIMLNTEHCPTVPRLLGCWHRGNKLRLVSSKSGSACTMRRWGTTCSKQCEMALLFIEYIKLIWLMDESWGMNIQPTDSMWKSTIS